MSHHQKAAQDLPGELHSANLTGILNSPKQGCLFKLHSAAVP